MSISVSYQSRLSVLETREGEFVDPNDATVTINGLNTEATLNSASTPPATKVSAGHVTITEGLISLNLTSLPDSAGTPAAVTLTGLKVQAAKFKAPDTNGASITVTFGASNGFTGFGAAFSFTFTPGMEVTFKADLDNGVDVDGSHCVFDLTGTGDTDVLDFEFIAG